jgi:hypothetical protein
MCNCIEDINNKISDDIKSRFSRPKKPVKGFRLQTTLSGSPIVGIDIVIEGQYKLGSSFIVCDFCPWCGVRL